MAEEGEGPECPKCEECVPGLPGWMATFSDLVTLLLTFFVLLLSFAKTESQKYEAALGSIRNAFGGNVLKNGEVIQRGKSADNSPTMIESQQIIRPFPIEFLTMEGILDKHEINRESDEDLKSMRNDLAENDLADQADVYEMPEGVKVIMKEKIYFHKGSAKAKSISVEAFEKLIKLLTSGNWTVMVVGHASKGEQAKDGRGPYELSALRAMSVSKSLIKRGVLPEKITTVFYGDSRPDVLTGNVKKTPEEMGRRVEFVLRKRDVTSKGHKVDPK